MSQQPLRRVLIVDDEPPVREMLAVALEMAGFEVTEADNAATALNQVTSSIPDLMLIDWMMPQVSGLELCRRLRRNPDTASIPLILLTARGEEDAKIKGIEEPVEFTELRLDPIGQRVTAFGRLLTLSPIEYRLLQLFMTNPDRAFSRTQLLDRVWGGDVYVEERTVDVHIRRLRKALGSAHEDLIQTVRGTGYRFSTTDLDKAH